MSSQIHKQWLKVAAQIQNEKNLIEQLSKIYIIIHQRIKKMMRNCSIDRNYDPIKDAQKHLLFIKDLLERLNKRKQDQYLESADKNVIGKFQEQLFGLIYQIEKTLQIQNIVSNIQVDELIRTPHRKTKGEHGLEDELKRSDKRRLRSKSGKKIFTGQKKNYEKNQQYNTLIPENNEAINDKLIVDLKQYKTLYLNKKREIQQGMEDHVETNNNQLIFSKKYSGNNLERYFQNRRDLAQLYFSDQFYKDIIKQGKVDIAQENMIEKNKSKRQNIETKLFTEFKIKAKYMKKQVRYNILNTLADAKKQLLQDFHSSNLAKLSEQNPNAMMSQVTKKKMKLKKQVDSPIRESSERKLKRASIQFKRQQTPFRKTFSSTRYMTADKSSQPQIYEHGWSKQIQQKQKSTLLKKLLESKVKSNFYN